MKLMNVSDFERLLGSWQANFQGMEVPVFNTPPGTCWFRSHTGFPCIGALKNSFSLDFRMELERYAGSNNAPAEIDLGPDVESVSEAEALEFINCLNESAAGWADIAAAQDEKASWELLCEKDKGDERYRYLLYPEDVSIAFQDAASEKDLIRNIFLGAVLRYCHAYIDYNSICGAVSDYSSWDYRVAQSACPQDMQKQAETLGSIYANASQAWALCVHVVNDIMSVAIFAQENGLPVVDDFFYDPAPGTPLDIDPVVMLFWRNKSESFR